MIVATTSAGRATGDGYKSLHAPATDNGESTRPGIGVQHSQDCGDERAYGVQLLVRHGEHNEGKTDSRYVLLMLHIAITGQERLETSGHG